MASLASAKSSVFALLILGCASTAIVTTVPEPAGEEIAGTETDIEDAPTPTPLIEVDPSALPEPAPIVEAEPEAQPAEPLPFNEEQLERIYAVQAIVAAASTAYGVDPSLVNGLIWVESKFEPRARGPAGAQGLMQLMPKTAKSLAKRLDRKRNSYDPDFNIHAGTLMLSRLLDRFEGDERLALAGYNRGGGTVSKWIHEGTPLPEGAEKFVVRVQTARALFERLPPEPPAPEADSPSEAEPEGGQDGESGDRPVLSEVVAVDEALDVAPVVGVLDVDVGRQ